MKSNFNFQTLLHHIYTIIGKLLSVNAKKNGFKSYHPLKYSLLNNWISAGTRRSFRFKRFKIDSQLLVTYMKQQVSSYKYKEKMLIRLYSN